MKKWVRIALRLVMIPILFPLFLIFLIISFCCPCMFCSFCFQGLLNTLGTILPNVKLASLSSLDWLPPPGKTQPDHLLQLLYYKSMYHYPKRNHKKAQPGIPTQVEDYCKCINS
ncbi:hypothetical protein OIU77_017984 [Salix suchowensis]|uniref:Uncharacterized protein n=1 Tax=Salix suchowensis TaxID=1278906 RepID=A0ABQ8ZR90_9ROSI|nr:hypothetical protein OIU77_017984 [Salix suchowensis]